MKFSRPDKNNGHQSLCPRCPPRCGQSHLLFKTTAAEEALQQRQPFFRDISNQYFKIIIISTLQIPERTRAEQKRQKVSWNQSQVQQQQPFSRCGQSHSLSKTILACHQTLLDFETTKKCDLTIFAKGRKRLIFQDVRGSL